MVEIIKLVDLRDVYEHKWTEVRKESNMVKNGDSSIKDDFQPPALDNVLWVGPITNT